MKDAIIRVAMYMIILSILATIVNITFALILSIVTNLLFYIGFISND